MFIYVLQTQVLLESCQSSQDIINVFACRSIVGTKNVFPKQILQLYFQDHLCQSHVNAP